MAELLSILKSRSSFWHLAPTLRPGRAWNKSVLLVMGNTGGVHCYIVLRVATYPRHSPASAPGGDWSRPQLLSPHRRPHPWQKPWHPTHTGLLARTGIPPRRQGRRI
eukprot:1149349-Pelagomonas_calceolata.AAC.1